MLGVDVGVDPALPCSPEGESKWGGAASLPEMSGKRWRPSVLEKKPSVERMAAASHCFNAQCVGDGKHWIACPRPPSLLYVALRSRGPPTMSWLGAPTRWKPIGFGINPPNILPLDLKLNT